MNINALGYTLDYAQQCAAWTINNQGPARKQCGLGANMNVAGWIYLCSRHYDLIFEAVERDVDNLNSRRVENLEARLAGVSRHEEYLLSSQRELQELLDANDQKRREQTVYFIRCQRFVKIGISKNPVTRLQQIRKGGGSHFPRLLDVETSELVATERGGFEREKELHAEFAHLRHTGEWFTEAPELTGYIESLDAAA